MKMVQFLTHFLLLIFLPFTFSKGNLSLTSHLYFSSLSLDLQQEKKEEGRGRKRKMKRKEITILKISIGKNLIRLSSLLDLTWYKK